MDDVSNDEAFSSVWNHLTGHSAEGTRQRLGLGETVPVSYVRSRARVLFVNALYRVAPETTTDLLRDEVFELLSRNGDARTLWETAAKHIRDRNSDGMTAVERVSAGKEQTLQMLSDPTYESVLTTSEVIDEYIFSWQQRYKLEDPWLATAAMRTLDTAENFREGGHSHVGPLQLPFEDIGAQVHEGKEEPLPPGRNPFTLRFIPEHKQVNVGVYLEHLKHPPVEFAEGVLEKEFSDTHHRDRYLQSLFFLLNLIWDWFMRRSESANP